MSVVARHSADPILPAWHARGNAGAVTGGVLSSRQIGALLGPSTFSLLLGLTGGYGIGLALRAVPALWVGVSSDVAEFIHRSLIHVLPDRFHRIRYYGFLGNRRPHRSNRARAPGRDARRRRGVPQESFLRCESRRCRGRHKRDPARGDGPNISPVVGALGEGHCSTGMDDGFVLGSSCDGGQIDYFIRGVGRHVAWPSAFTASIRGQLSQTSGRSDAG